MKYSLSLREIPRAEPMWALHVSSVLIMITALVSIANSEIYPWDGSNIKTFNFQYYNVQ